MHATPKITAPFTLSEREVLSAFTNSHIIYLEALASHAEREGRQPTKKLATELAFWRNLAAKLKTS